MTNIKPRPDFDGMTAAEIQAEIVEIEENLIIAREPGCEDIQDMASTGIAVRLKPRLQDEKVKVRKARKGAKPKLTSLSRW